MAKWWVKFKCRITGGHRYDSGEIRSRRIPEHGVTCFIHRCVKCGEYQVYAVDDKALYYVPPYLERKSKNDTKCIENEVSEGENC